MNIKEYDIVFWAYNPLTVDRHIPVMAGLNKKGVNTLLFYMDYGMENTPPAHEVLIRKYGLNVLTYADLLQEDLLLNVVSSGIKLFKNTCFYNKLRGLRSKLLSRKIDRTFVASLLSLLKPKVNIFDTINLMEESDFPIGNFKVKKISNELGIPEIAIPHGIRTHYEKHTGTGKFVDFKKVVIGNHDEMEYMRSICTDNVEDIIPIGDPRYDSLWKNEIKDLFSNATDENEQNKKVLYILPSMEQFGMEKQKYDALARVSSLVASMGNMKLFIRPHPRHRHEDKIVEVVKASGLKDFEVIGAGPLIAYAEEVDHIISPVSSALFDFMPELSEKIIIHYDFPEKEKFINIFKGYVKFSEDIPTLKNYLLSEKEVPVVSKKEMEEYCDKWVADSKGLNTIIDRYVNLILDERKREKTN